MKRVFADTSYWIALLHPKDEQHESAKRVSTQLGDCRIVTTEMVLVELLNGLAKYGEAQRKAAVRLVAALGQNPNVDVFPQTSIQFKDAVARYTGRMDKEWGLTDCASFVLMEKEGIREVLTADHHFEQAGFKILMEASE